MESLHRPYGPYERYFKRPMDFTLSLLALIVLSPFLIVFTVVGAIAMKGNPFFTQLRPGKNEKIFRLIKFRTMTNAKDADGRLMPDEKRLNGYGKFLRSTSIDELPELLNILFGHMSIVGPRPQLVRDVVFMTPLQKKRHCVRPGLTGLAQVNGRNNITWERKFEYDLEYINNLSFICDVTIIFRTVLKVFMRADTVRDGTESDMDFGDYLLQKNAIDIRFYDDMQGKAKELLNIYK